MIATAPCAWFRTSSDEGEPDVELVCLGGLAAQSDVAVGADGYQAAAGGAGEAVDVDQRAGRQRVGPVRVALEQHVHARPGEQFVQPDNAPGATHSFVGQSITRARAGA